MTCDRPPEEISALIDGELDELRRTALCAHAEACDECRDMIEDYRRLRSHLTAGARVKAPADLAARVHADLRREAVIGEAPAKPARAASWLGWRQAAAVLVMCGLSAAGGWIGGLQMARTDDLERELVASHVRALLQDQPFQVASSNTHNVKPWFAGRVEFSPEVKDLSAAGFDLIGGRLDYVGGRRVGVVVYKHGQHWIDVYAWPAASTAAAIAVPQSVRGYNLVSWTKGGLVYWAISDLNKEELGRLESLL